MSQSSLRLRGSSRQCKAGLIRPRADACTSPSLRARNRPHLVPQHLAGPDPTYVRPCQASPGHIGPGLVSTSLACALVSTLVLVRRHTGGIEYAIGVVVAGAACTVTVVGLKLVLALVLVRVRLQKGESGYAVFVGDAEVVC